MSTQVFAKMLINGASRESNNSVDVLNPATGTAFATCFNSSTDDLDDAVTAARNAFKGWSETPDSQRKEALLEIAQLLEDNMPELMALVTQENGKPMNGFQGIGSGMEVGGSVAWIQATTSFELPIEIIQDDDAMRVEVHRKPLGVVASITPWNWPLLIAIWHVIPALRTGNTVIIKPSENTPVATSRFVELANTVLPKGVLNIVHGKSEIGAAMAQHTDIDKLIFTGSTPTGRRIMNNASVNLKRLTLELGGNDAGIVLPDVDAKAIAPELFLAGFHNNGQTCACLKRLYLHESQYDEVCNELAAIANNITVGNGLEDDTDLGPCQNAKQRVIVSDLVEDARTNGGRVLSGGAAIGDMGFFYGPTIVAGLSDGNRLVDEEQFGPALPVIKYSDLDEVIERSNRSDNGLGGSVWSNDIDAAQKVAKRMECGTVWINSHGGVQPNAPFGGVKQSGVGVEFGTHGLAEYTSIQTLLINK